MLEAAPSTRPDHQIIRELPIPYHYQLREILRQEVVTGQWPVNERLPSERELCERFGVSRPTVREALDALVLEGLLRREKGRGTFVAEPKIVEGLLQTPYGFTDSMATAGIPVETTVLRLEVSPAPLTVARELRLREGSPVVCIDRLRRVMEVPILLVSSFLPEQMFPGLIDEDFTVRSLYQILRSRYGVSMTRARRYMEAVGANRHEAELLGIAPGAPLMLIESTTYTGNGVPFEYYRAQHRGDRTRFLVESFQTVVSEDHG